MENFPARVGVGRVVERQRDRPRYVDGRRLEALMAVAAEASARQLLSAATQSVVEMLGERGSAVLVDGGPRVVLATHAPGLTNLPVDLARYPEIVTALESDNVVAIEDVHSDPLMTPVRDLLPRPLGAVAVVPMIVGDHRIGVLMAQSASTRSFGAEVVATAALIGRFTGLVLESRLGRRVDLVFTGTHDTLLAAGDPANPQGAGLEDGEPAPAGKRVLLVDDDVEHAGAVTAALRNAGYDVDGASDGADGLRRARERRPDVILLGVCLPVLDGISAAERLREDPRTRAVPIIFLTGVDELLHRARHATFDKVDYLPRTKSLPDLLARVDHWVRASRPG